MADFPKHVLVAGGTGMTGTGILRHLTTHLPTTQFRATWRNTPPFFRSPQVEWLQVDLTQRSDCEAALSGCDAAILAAASTGGASHTQVTPDQQMTDNLVMDALLLEALHRQKVVRCLYLSSATVYQEVDGAVREDELDLNQDPHPAYLGVGWAKRSAEKLCQFWHSKYGVQCVVLRCANIYGPYARFDPRRSNFIPALIRKAVDHLDPFEVWGAPTVVRDVVFVEDIARIVEQALLQTHIDYAVLNCGSGHPVTVDEVVRSVLVAAEHEPAKVVYNQDQPTTIRLRLLSCERLHDTLGVRTRVSLGEGVHRTTQWWRENRRWWSK